VELVYIPESLKILSALQIKNAHLSVNRSALSKDIADLLDDSSFHCSYQTKPRDCQEITEIRVGNFGDFPHALERVDPCLYSTKIRKQAHRVLEFLEQVDKEQRLDNAKVMGYSYFRRYPVFLKIQAQHPDLVLVPPIDVEAIWYSHMLQTDVYPQFAAQFGSSLPHIPHVVTRHLTPQQRKKSERKCEKLWKKAAPSEPFSFTGQQGDLVADQMWSYDPVCEDLVADRMWYRELRRATEGVDISAKAFLRRAVLGFQRFMYLLTKYPVRTETCAFSPCPPIDLIWHTLLVQPKEWEQFRRKVITRILHHKLLPSTLRREMTYDPQNDPEEALWLEEFGESMNVYVGPVLPGKEKWLRVHSNGATEVAPPPPPPF